MSDHSISIVPQHSIYPDNKAKAQEILNWLVSNDIVKPTTSDCILDSENGYPISCGAKKVTDNEDQLPFGLITNGLEITTRRQIFHTGQNGMDACICPNCKENFASDVWDLLNDWFEQKSDNLICTKCGQETEINNYNFKPHWGFSNLGFTFWNWLDLKVDFIEEFQKRLGTEINIVHTHI